MDELKCPKCGENLKVTPIGNEGAYGKKCECGYIARNDLALAFDWQKKAYQFADDFEMAVHKTLELVATLSELRVRVEGIEVGEIQDVIDAERNTGINWTYNMAKSVKSFLIKTLLKGGQNENHKRVAKRKKELPMKNKVGIVIGIVIGIVVALCADNVPKKKCQFQRIYLSLS